MSKIKKRKQKQTLREFKAWLQGVEELQPDNWCPNRDQWILIREKIDSIIEEKPVEKIVEKQTVGNSGLSQMPQYPQMTQMPQMTQPVVPGIMPAPPVPGGVPMSAPVEMSSQAKKLLNPAANGGKIKTPDIDTTNGTFESSFS